MKTLFGAIILVLLLLSAPAISACSCAGYPTVCDSYRKANAVFIGLVQRVRDNKVKDEEGKEYIGGQGAYIQVEKYAKLITNTITETPRITNVNLNLCFLAPSNYFVGVGEFESK